MLEHIKTILIKGKKQHIYLLPNPYEIQGFGKMGLPYFTLTQVLLSISNSS
jgi:hypothetical protein